MSPLVPTLMYPFATYTNAIQEKTDEVEEHRRQIIFTELGDDAGANDG